jgi:hypothetical protein
LLVAHGIVWLSLVYNIVSVIVVFPLMRLLIGQFDARAPDLPG